MMKMYSHRTVPRIGVLFSSVSMLLSAYNNIFVPIDFFHNFMSCITFSSVPYLSTILISDLFDQLDF